MARTGGRYVVFPYCISIVVLTFRRHSGPVYIPPGGGTFVAALPYLLISMCFGWWGFPFGLIFTPICIVQCLTGGRDVSGRVAGRLNG